MSEDRQRKAAEVFDPSSFDKERAAVDLSKGQGAKLRALPEWPTTRTTTALEDALAPLHRIVFGSPGKKGERRDSLADFCGFDPVSADKSRAKIGQWSKEQLRALVVALGIKGIKVSQPLTPLQDEVFAFLNKPTLPETTKRERPAENATDEAKPKKLEATRETPAKQRAKQEPKVTGAVDADSIADDAVRVEVYKRILAMKVEDHAKVSAKALRQEIEQHFGLAEDALKSRKKVVEEVATTCIRAVHNAIKSFGAAPQAAAAADASSIVASDEPKAAAPAAIEPAASVGTD